MSQLALQVNNLHIRFEDDIFNQNWPYSLGLITQNILLKTHDKQIVVNLDSPVTQQPPEKNIKTKIIESSNLGVYIDSLSEMMVPSSLWEATFQS